MVDWDPRYRIVMCNRNNDARLVCMLHSNSSFAHTVYRGSIQEIADLIVELEFLIKSY